MEQRLSYTSASGHSPDRTCRDMWSDHSPINTIKFDFGDYPSKYDEISDVLRVAPEDLASQLTLIDHSIFVAIQPEELSSCQWTGSKKYQLSPNVVAFTQRFNRVSFWVVQEILSHPSVKQRSDVLAHFVKLSKRLVQLNNLHSAFAVKSALSSAPIHRLSKTWAHLSKKDKQSFERLSELFSESDNFDRLRQHLTAANMPCIPYLGIFLHDIVYIDVAHPQTNGRENPQRTQKMNAVLRVIALFQQSSYDNLPIIPSVQKYLLSVRYIEELQKFLEDDNYKLSLRLEPPESDSKSNSTFYIRPSSHPIRPPQSSHESHHLSAPPQSSHSAQNHSIPSSASLNRLSTSFNFADSMPVYGKKLFTPAHRRAHSLGTNVLSSISMTSIIPMTSKLSKHTKVEKNNRCLIDDSVISEEPVVKTYENLIPLLPKFDILYDEDEEETSDAKCFRDVKVNRFADNNYLLSEDKIIFQGMVKRKTALKDGKKPSITNSWVRYWLVLQGTHLFYFDPKYFKNNYRINIYRSTPLKCRSLRGWFVALVEDSPNLDTFTLSDSSGKNIYKFQTPTSGQAYEWYKRMSQVISDLKSSRKTSRECLIDFEEDSSNKNRLHFPYSSSQVFN